LSGAFEVDPSQKPSIVVISFIKALGFVMPKLPVKALFDETLIVSDANALQAWRDDPLCSKDKVRVGYILELLRCSEEMKNIIPTINIPMLLQCGSADRVVTVSGHELMARESKSSDTQLKVYDGGYHNLLQEPELKTQVMADIREWILARSK